MKAYAIKEPAMKLEPSAWTIPGDDTADMNGFIPAKAWREDEFTKPLFTLATVLGALREPSEAMRVVGAKCFGGCISNSPEGRAARKTFLAMLDQFEKENK